MTSKLIEPVKSPKRTPTALLSPADQERRRGLRVMKGVALGALLLMAVLFLFAFAFQEQVPALAYVRAFAEGGMVGALADWFAVTALFRHPLGIPIPHTAIIPNRKDEIGQNLGEFVETEFLRGDVVRTKLEETAIASKLGEWLKVPAHAERVRRGGLPDGRRRAARPQRRRRERCHRRPRARAPPGAGLGSAARRLARPDRRVRRPSRRRRPRASTPSPPWLAANQASFTGLVSRRLPAWVPSIAQRLVDDTVYNEAVKFVAAVRTDPKHPARIAIDGYLDRLADNLQHDPATMARLEETKATLFDSPRIRELAVGGLEHRESRTARIARRPGERSASPRRSGARRGRRRA